MTRAFHFLLLAMLMICPHLAARADIPTEYTRNEVTQEDDYTYTIRGTFTAKGTPGTVNENAYVLIGFEGRLQLGLLALDPVVSFKMRFKPLGGRITIPNFDPGAQAYNTIGLAQVPSAAVEKIDLTNVRVAFQFLEQTNEVVIVEDSGAFFGQGEWSFNVPDGYSWRNVFYEGGFGKLDFSDHPHVGRDRAREIWGGMRLGAFEVINAELLLSDLHHWYRQYDTTGDYYATLRAIDRVSEGISLSYGFDPYPGMKADILEAKSIAASGLSALQRRPGFDSERIIRFGEEPDYMADFAKATCALRRILSKLTNLPEKFRSGNNHDPYRVAVNTVDSVLSEPGRLRHEFRPEGPANASVPRGREPKFDSASDQNKTSPDARLTEPIAPADLGTRDLAGNLSSIPAGASRVWVNTAKHPDRHRNRAHAFIVHGKQRVAGPFDQAFWQDAVDPKTNETRNFVVGMCDTSDPDNKMWVKLVRGLTLEVLKTWRGYCLASAGSHYKPGQPQIRLISGFRNIRYDENQQTTVAAFDNIMIDANTFEKVGSFTSPAITPLCSFDSRVRGTRPSMCRD